MKMLTIMYFANCDRKSEKVFIVSIFTYEDLIQNSDKTDHVLSLPAKFQNDPERIVGDQDRFWSLKMVIFGNSRVAIENRACHRITHMHWPLTRKNFG